MAVRTGDRGYKEDDLRVINASKDLLDYTYDRVKDRNIFPKAERWLLAKSIWDNAVEARSCIVKANAIRVETYDEASERLLLEKKALGCLDTLETLIDLAHSKRIIDDRRTEYWVGLVVTTLTLLRGWLKSDRSRYKPLIGRKEN